MKLIQMTVFGATGIDGWYNPATCMTQADVDMVKSLKLDYFHMYHFSVWRVTEWNKGVFTFGPMDANVDMCIKNGLKVFDTMPELRYIPDWPTRPEVDAYATIDEMVPVSRELARRYKGKILGWTIGGEINLLQKSAVWLTDDVRNYYFRKLSEAIRTEDSSALIMLTAGGDSSINLYNWFKSIIDAGIDFDVMCPHPYFCTANYQACLGWDPTPATVIEWSFGGPVGSRVVDLPKPIWLTEIGFFPDAKECTLNHTTDEEIAIMNEALTILQRDYPQITGFFWFPWKTSFNATGGVRMWGLVNADRSINAVGQQWQTFTSNPTLWWKWPLLTWLRNLLSARLG